MTEKWYSASSPGKFVILGEHSVVYGKPAVVLASDRRVHCSIRESDSFTLNGYPFNIENQPHLNYLMNNRGKSYDVYTSSSIPSGAGMGSSAALSSAVAKTIHMEAGEDVDEKTLVEEAYGAELFAQGSGSPMDASACVHGGGIAINIPEAADELWTISRNGRTWRVSDIKVPYMSFVIGFTGVKAPTGPQVDKVRRFKEKNGFASDIIDEIGEITMKGYYALIRNDKRTLGKMMTEDHKLLSILGVSCPELNRLVNAALPYSYGAKLTGSGGGGCMVALTDEPRKVADTIKLWGGTPYIIKSGIEGTREEEYTPRGTPLDIPIS